MASKTENDWPFRYFDATVAIVHDTLVRVNLSICITHWVLDVQAIGRTKWVQTTAKFPVDGSEAKEKLVENHMHFSRLSCEPASTSLEHETL